MKAFLDAAGGHEPAGEDDSACTIEEAAHVLAVTDAVRAEARSDVTIRASHGILTLRPAELDDTQNLLRWRNDSATRSASFNGDEVSPTEHATWLEHTLSDPDRHLMIANEDGEPVGQLRLDRLERDTVEVHIAVAPEARGRGLAAALLRVAAREHAPTLGANWLLARVKADNEASRRSFHKAGFHQSSEHPGEWWFELPPRNA